MIFHVPVLLCEVLAGLVPGPGKVFFDATLGAGGHSEALLERGARVIGCDQDAEALQFARQRLARFGDRFVGLRGNFQDIKSLLGTVGVEKVDGILADLGVSSLHVDRADRGFSFMKRGPLDMRMDQSAELSAKEIVAEWSEAELVRIFREFGEEPQARRVAAAIVQEREVRSFETTEDLAGFLEKILGRHSGKHPGTKVFQALRIAVNHELDVLKEILQAAPALLHQGGRFAVISFHSLEDRMVKRDFAARSKIWIDRPEWSAAKPNPERVYRLPQKAAVASEGELQENRRARSARLRVAERLEENPVFAI